MKQSQKLLLTWLIENTGLYHKIKKYIAPKDFTEEIYHKVAEVLFQQFEESGEANPAKIVSMFPDEEAQKEIAALFNARIHEVESKEDREKALKGDHYPHQTKQYQVSVRAFGTDRYGWSDAACNR